MKIGTSNFYRHCAVHFYKTDMTTVFARAHLDEQTPGFPNKTVNSEALADNGRATCSTLLLLRCKQDGQPRSTCCRQRYSQFAKLSSRVSQLLEGAERFLSSHRAAGRWWEMASCVLKGGARFVELLLSRHTTAGRSNPTPNTNSEILSVDKG